MNSKYSSLKSYIKESKLVVMTANMLTGLEVPPMGKEQVMSFIHNMKHSKLDVSGLCSGGLEAELFIRIAKNLLAELTDDIYLNKDYTKLVSMYMCVYIASGVNI